MTDARPPIRLGAFVMWLRHAPGPVAVGEVADRADVVVRQQALINAVLGAVVPEACGTHRH